MKDKILLVGIMLLTLLILGGCGKKSLNKVADNRDAIKFKEEYEALNDKLSKEKINRNISIPKDNPIVYITPTELLAKMDNKKSFYVYFGSKFCPWCRSVIEKAIEVAKKKSVNTIYYIDIWDDEGNEILRDKYILNDNNELEQTVKGTDEYYEILNRFDNVLSDYTLKDSDGNQIAVSEKRIFAPNFVYVEKGKASKLVSGISSQQQDSRGELTDEILKDETEVFNNFFAEDCGC